MMIIEHLPEFILHHWALCLALVVILVMLFIYERRDYLAQSKQVSPQEVVFLINNEKGMVFDMRDQVIFEKGHIVDALHIACDKPALPSLQKYKKQPVILVCEQGKVSALHAPKWKEAGFEHVTTLSGGIAAWKEAGFPLINHKDSHEQKNKK